MFFAGSLLQRLSALARGASAGSLAVMLFAIGVVGCGGETAGSGESVSTSVGDSESSTPLSYADAWGPAVGSALAVLDAPDQSGTRQTLASLSGDQGMLLFLNRSADW